MMIPMVPGFFGRLFEKPKLNLAWVFVFLNVAVFFYTQFNFSSWPSPSLDAKLTEKDFSYSIVEMYRQTLDPVEISRFGKEIKAYDAIRDARFWKKVSTFPFRGDQVQIELNRVKLAQFQQEYMASSAYNLGLGQLESSPWAWLTYQFTHASILHLVMNLLVIFLLISLLENQVGSFWLISVYLLGGFGGGIGYLLFENSGSMAMVGSSASAVALMAFVVIIKQGQLIPWSYVTVFKKSGYAMIYLPAFFIFPHLMMADFLVALTEQGSAGSSVATFAHIGGAITGFILGFFYLAERRFTRHLIRIWQIDERKLAEIENLD